MTSSSEFIKGYTKIIICSYLYKKRDYLYNIVKHILIDGEQQIKLSNPSALMVIKQLEEDNMITSTIEISNQNQARKYYSLTEKGIKFYQDNYLDYIKSLNLLIKMIGGDLDEKK